MHRFRSHLALVVLAPLLAPSCKGLPSAPESLAYGETRLGLSGAIVQSVTLTPPSPVTGDDLTIRSVLVNRGSRPVELSSRICGLELGGSLELGWPPGLVKCAGYSQQGALAPGDSVASVEIMRVHSPPGDYTLRVRHALDPAGAVEVRVSVQSP